MIKVSSIHGPPSVFGSVRLLKYLLFVSFLSLCFPAELRQTGGVTELTACNLIRLNSPISSVWIQFQPVELLRGCLAGRRDTSVVQTNIKNYQMLGILSSRSLVLV